MVRRACGLSWAWAAVRAERGDDGARDEPRSLIPNAHHRSWVARPGARMEKLDWDRAMLREVGRHQRQPRSSTTPLLSGRRTGVDGSRSIIRSIRLVRHGAQCRGSWVIHLGPRTCRTAVVDSRAAMRYRH